MEEPNNEKDIQSGFVSGPGSNKKLLEFIDLLKKNNATERAKNMDLLKENFQIKVELSSRNNLIKMLEEDLLASKTRENSLATKVKELEAKITKYRQIFKFIKKKKNSNSPSRDSPSRKKKNPKDPYTTENVSEEESLSINQYELPASYIDKDFSIEITDSMMKAMKESNNKARPYSARRGFQSENMKITKEASDNTVKTVEKKLIFNKEDRALSSEEFMDKEITIMGESIEITNPELNSFLNDELKDIVFGKNFFEKFFIIGADKSDLRKSQLQTKPASCFTPKILYAYPETSNLSKPKEEIVAHFAFPLGVEATKMKITDSFSQLNEIIYAAHNTRESIQNCFTFVLKTDDDFDNEKKVNNKLSQLIQVCNPNKLMYGVCYITNDFADTNTPQRANQKKADSKKQSKKNVHFWSVKKAYCFLSAYPITKFFFDVLTSLLNFIKINKMRMFTETPDEGNDLFLKIDSEFAEKFLKKDLEGILKKFLMTPVPNFSSTVSFQNFGDSGANPIIEFTIPNKQLSKYLDAEWGSITTFSNLHPDLFVFIFFSLLLETSIIFFSPNIPLLSSTITIFQSLLKPFKWVFPLIITLPEYLNGIFDSPVPILVGVPRDFSYVKNNKLDELHSSCIFISLDNELQVLNLKATGEMPLAWSTKLAMKLKPFFSVLISNTSQKPYRNSWSSPKQIRSKTPTKNTPEKTPANLDERQICHNICTVVQDFLQNEIIQYIPKNKKFLDGKVINYKMIQSEVLSKHVEHNSFLARFVNSQMFTLYIEELYSSFY